MQLPRSSCSTSPLSCYFDLLQIENALSQLSPDTALLICHCRGGCSNSSRGGGGGQGARRGRSIGIFKLTSKKNSWGEGVTLLPPLDPTLHWGRRHRCLDWSAARNCRSERVSRLVSWISPPLAPIVIYTILSTIFGAKNESRAVGIYTLNGTFRRNGCSWTSLYYFQIHRRKVKHVFCAPLTLSYEEPANRCIGLTRSNGPRGKCDGMAQPPIKMFFRGPQMAVQGCTVDNIQHWNKYGPIAILGYPRVHHADLSIRESPCI